jgi:hypothetical protein
MRNTLLLIPYLLLSSLLYAQSEAGIEQYHYIGSPDAASVVPVGHFKTKKGWYAEARYNYDEINTFSFLGGKTFCTKGKWELAITPMIGVAFGELNGWTAGTNVSLERGAFFFNTQSQYTISLTEGYNNFFFNWLEFGYQPLDWLYGGISVQHTQLAHTKALVEPGIMLGASFRRISFPLYAFNTFSRNRFFVLGVNWEWRQ